MANLHLMPRSVTIPEWRRVNQLATNGDDTAQRKIKQGTTRIQCWHLLAADGDEGSARKLKRDREQDKKYKRSIATLKRARASNDDPDAVATEETHTAQRRVKPHGSKRRKSRANMSSTNGTPAQSGSQVDDIDQHPLLQSDTSSETGNAQSFLREHATYVVDLCSEGDDDDEKEEEGEDSDRQISGVERTNGLSSTNRHQRPFRSVTPIKQEETGDLVTESNRTVTQTVNFSDHCDDDDDETRPIKVESRAVTEEHEVGSGQRVFGHEEPNGTLVDDGMAIEPTMEEQELELRLKKNNVAKRRAALEEEGVDLEIERLRLKRARRA